MNYCKLFLLLWIPAFAGMTLAYSSACSQSAGDIIESYVSAIGGVEKISAISSMKITGRFADNQLDVPFVETIKRPGNVKFEVTMQGLTQQQAYDGSVAWILNPFRGAKFPDRMSEGQTRDMRNEIEMIETHLLGSENKGSVELAAKEYFEGTEAYKLRLVNKTGDIYYYLVDANNYLLLKEIAKMKIGEREQTTEKVFSNYKLENGIMMPHTIDVTVTGSSVSFRRRLIDKVEFNVTVDDAIFKMPEGK